MAIKGSGFDSLRNLVARMYLSRFVPFMAGLQSKSGRFKSVGSAYLDLFREYGGLKPSEAVLDIGCGTGRMTTQMTDFLDSEGSYCGLDVAKRCIRRCEREFAASRPNFHFAHLDVYNGRYNRRGTTPASEYRFPFPDATFDFIILISVFTHMLEKDTVNYFSEIGRLLAPGGRAFMTFFLLDEERAASISKGESRFKYPKGRCYVQQEQQPEFAVAYPVNLIAELLAQNNLNILDQPHLGSWDGRQSGLEYQDVAIAVKP